MLKKRFHQNYKLRKKGGGGYSVLVDYQSLPPVDRAVTRLFLEREVRGSNRGSVESDKVLLTVHHRCDIYSKGAVLPGRNNAEMGPANLV